MVRRSVSVPEGVERIRLIWEIVWSVFLRYSGSHERRISVEGRRDAEGIAGRGRGKVSEE
jgi:hypothetical protein